MRFNTRIELSEEQKREFRKVWKAVWNPKIKEPLSKIKVREV